MSGYGGLSKSGLSNWQWHNFSKYWQRIGHLYAGLKQLGHTPALCLSYPSVHTVAKGAPVFAVYPYLPDATVEAVSVNLDPLIYPQMGNKLSPILDRYTRNGKNEMIIFKPGGLRSDLRGVFAAQFPRQVSDLQGIFPEFTVRLANKLTGYRHIF